jgi:nitrile hydratase subunit beta
MDGVHDLGGAAGFGRVEIEADEPVFHAAWEGRVFGLAGEVLMAGGYDTPTFRHAIERMEPSHYLSSSYFEHWLTAVASLAVEGGLIDRAELIAGAGDFALSGPVASDPVPEELAVEPVLVPRFRIGDRVRVRNLHPRGHTRCPGYVRNRQGDVVRIDVDNPVPELEAHRGVRVVEPVYCVRFTQQELWGDGGSVDTLIHVDLYDRYLEAP